MKGVSGAKETENEGCKGGKEREEMKDRREKETDCVFLDIGLNIKQKRVNGLVVRAIDL